MIPGLSVDWTEADGINLRLFLRSNPKFMVALRDRFPKINGATIEERAMSASEVSGAEQIMNSIFTMCAQQPMSQESDMVNLDPVHKPKKEE